MKYYLVSYAHDNWFWNTFFEVSKWEFDIRYAETSIQKSNNFKNKPILITINKIKKSQFVDVK